LALDVDGVLLDPTAGGGGWATALHERFGVDPDALRSSFFQRFWPEIIVGRAAIEPALATAITDLGWTMTADALLECWFEADLVVDDDVADAARAWSADGARIVLVTNQEHRRAAFLRQRLRTVLPPSDMAYSAAIGFMKKDPEFFPLASDQLGIDRQDKAVVFVDDTLENVAAARRHGWFAIHFTKAPGWRDEISAALSPRR
jgi:putative hydrolase of the HAD superfamily